MPAWRRAKLPHGFVSISHAQRLPIPDLHWAGNIPHGLPLDQYTFHSEPGRYLAFLGRICPEKRPEWAVQIAKQAGIPLKIAAKIEGREGQDWYDRMIKPHVDGRFIEYIGEISDSEKSEFLGNALGLVFPIDWPEPFGLVMIEALACGTPVLARPFGSVPEVLDHGRTGYISADVANLARLARELPTLKRRECRREAEVRFSLQRMTEDYLDVYRRIRKLGDVGESYHRRNILHPVERSAERNAQAHSQG
jgi:glycosyltransferase involved in cell wall biosynthesis